MTIERKWLVTDIDPTVLIGESHTWRLGFSENPSEYRVRVGLRDAFMQRKRSFAGFYETEDEKISFSTGHGLLGGCMYFIREKRMMTDDGWLICQYGFPFRSILLATKLFPPGEYARPEWMLDAVEVSGALSSCHLARIAPAIFRAVRHEREVLPVLTMPHFVLLGGGREEKFFLMQGIATRRRSPYVRASNYAAFLTTALANDAHIRDDGEASDLLRDIQSRISGHLEALAEEYAKYEGKRAIVTDGGDPSTEYRAVIDLGSDSTLTERWRTAQNYIRCPEGSLEERAEFVEGLLFGAFMP